MIQMGSRFSWMYIIILYMATDPCNYLHHGGSVYVHKCKF